jgi:hypothetical protein
MKHGPGLENDVWPYVDGERLGVLILRRPVACRGNLCSSSPVSHVSSTDIGGISIAPRVTWRRARQAHSKRRGARACRELIFDVAEPLPTVFRRTERLVGPHIAPTIVLPGRWAGSRFGLICPWRSLLVGERFTSQVAVLPEMLRQVDTNAERHGRPDPGRSAAVLRIRRAPTAGSAHA